ncbi:dimodular nonribosomal peptide synthase [Clostridium puniceum]|uniref:Dimodular nonribosomal peptide synthase n=1 Tax=Clostridium puniceum TaxID=29367 RepID=A0A1S8T7J0_9CLOT|nr:acyl carrier protein [Clostridium puniceum]OOM73632.1 dimodular nonribosomal peptide synthase [Clostridium puniceum]
MEIDIYVPSDLEKKTDGVNNRRSEKRIQEILIDIFKKVLEIEKVSISDSFYDLGGHSFKLMMLINYIEKKFGVRLKIQEAMQAKTIENFSLIISKANNFKKFKEIPPAIPLE